MNKSILIFTCMHALTMNYFNFPLVYVLFGTLIKQHAHK